VPKVDTNNSTPTVVETGQEDYPAGAGYQIFKVAGNIGDIVPKNKIKGIPSGSCSLPLVLSYSRGMNMSELRTSLGKRIQAFRRDLRLTQEQLAEKAGLSVKHLGEIERGRGNPTLSSLENLAVALNISVVQMFGYESEKLSPGRIRSEIRLMIQNASDEKCTTIIRVLKALADA
jgi:transcriptional regulator with XRE-family HTH domain